MFLTYHRIILFLLSQALVIDKYLVLLTFLLYKMPPPALKNGKYNKQHEIPAKE